MSGMGACRLPRAGTAMPAFCKLLDHLADERGKIGGPARRDDAAIDRDLVSPFGVIPPEYLMSVWRYDVHDCGGGLERLTRLDQFHLFEAPGNERTPVVL